MGSNNSSQRQHMNVAFEFVKWAGLEFLLVTLPLVCCLAFNWFYLLPHHLHLKTRISFTLVVSILWILCVGCCCGLSFRFLSQVILYMYYKQRATNAVVTTAVNYLGTFLYICLLVPNLIYHIVRNAFDPAPLYAPQ